MGLLWNCPGSRARLEATLEAIEDGTIIDRVVTEVGARRERGYLRMGTAGDIADHPILTDLASALYRHYGTMSLAFSRRPWAVPSTPGLTVRESSE
jgi:hypothetical protein